MNWKNLGVIALILIVLSLGAVTVYFYAEGSLLPGTDCSWEQVPQPPGQADGFESVDQFVEEFSNANPDISESDLRDAYEFRESNGEIQYRSCGVDQ